jgi:adenylyltransferase/sulfurtransferase
MEVTDRTPPYEEISPRELKDRLDRSDAPVLLDVREPWETEVASIEGSVVIPLNQLLERYAELDPDAETVAICHHGARSAFATQALTKAGFRKVANLQGGIDAYAMVDPSIPRY